MYFVKIRTFKGFLANEAPADTDKHVYGLTPIYPFTDITCVLVAPRSKQTMSMGPSLPGASAVKTQVNEASAEDRIAPSSDVTIKHAYKQVYLSLYLDKNILSRIV